MTDRTAAPTTRWPASRTVVLLCFAAVFISYLDRSNLSVAAIPMQQELGWTESVKGLVLSSFFVGYLLLQVGSGWLTNRYGGRRVLGAAVLWWSLFTLLTPLAARYSLPALLAARIALGIGEAAVFPGSFNMLARWVRLEHRTRAVALVSSGVAMGTVIALPVTGWIIRDFGWPMAFYAFGALGFLWAMGWYPLVREGRDPAMTNPADAAPRTVPWGRLLRAPAVWAIIINHFCHNWSLYVLLAWLPSYFKSTFDVSLASAGLLSAAPWLCSFAMANAAGAWADRMLTAGMSATRVRRRLQCLGLLGGATFLSLIPLAPSAAIATVLMCGAAGALACCMAGFGANGLDIAPRYADVIWGISNTAGTIPGIVGVYVTGWLVEQTGAYTAPFLVTAAISVGGAVVYVLMGSGERQFD